MSLKKDIITKRRLQNSSPSQTNHIFLPLRIKHKKIKSCKKIIKYRKLFYLYIENKREIKLDQKESKENDDRYIGIENILNNKKTTKKITK